MLEDDERHVVLEHVGFMLQFPDVIEDLPNDLGGRAMAVLADLFDEPFNFERRFILVDPLGNTIGVECQDSAFGDDGVPALKRNVG